MLITQQPCLTCWPMRGYVATSPSHVHGLQPLTASGRSAGDPSSVSSVPCLSLADKSCLPQERMATPHSAQDASPCCGYGDLGSRVYSSVPGEGPL